MRGHVVHATHHVILPVFCPTGQTPAWSKNLNAINAVLLCMGLFSIFLFAEHPSADKA
jgi:hypothetical protein